MDGVVAKDKTRACRFVSSPGMQAVETDIAAGEKDKVWSQVCGR